MRNSRKRTGRRLSDVLDRREFLLTAGTAVAAAVVGACDAGTAPGEGGTIRVSVSGIVGSVAPTVAVTLMPSGSSPDVVIPLGNPSGSGVSEGVGVNVPPASYRITLSPPASHRVIGAFTAQQVELRVGAVETVSFEVQAFGGLQVTVRGITAGAPAAGSVGVTLAAGGAPVSSVSLSAPAGGNSFGLNSLHPVGTFRVTHTPPADHSHVGGDNVEDVTVPLGGLAVASFQVQASVTTPSNALVFASDWRSALGSTDSAVRDVAKRVPWTLTGQSPETRDGEVIPSTGLDFPTANVFRIGYGVEGGGQVQVNNQWTVPAVGESIYYRMYMRSALSQSSFGPQHTVQPGTGGGVSLWAFFHTPGSSNALDQYIRNNYAGTGLPDDKVHAWLFPMQMHATYRIEWAFRRISTEGFKMQARLYRASGEPLLDDSTVTCGRGGHGGHSLATSGAAANVEMLTSNIPSFTSFRIHDQGDYQLVAPNKFVYYGGVAISRTDWCGPYALGEESRIP